VAHVLIFNSLTVARKDILPSQKCRKRPRILPLWKCSYLPQL